jgi:SAM-dependent methyltransferase
MDFHPKNWNDDHKKRIGQNPKYDLWLDKHDELLRQSTDIPVVDLGCGLGNNSLYLIERGYKVLACDISEVAVSYVKKHVPGVSTLTFDMLHGLPFDDSSVNVMIADLSLHYFSWNDTISVVREIRRVLTGGGTLLCRVNSTNDKFYGAGQGIVIEENYYSVNGDLKRFFDREAIDNLFCGWNIIYATECKMDRYRHPKILWEIAAKTRAGGLLPPDIRGTRRVWEVARPTPSSDA